MSPSPRRAGLPPLTLAALYLALVALPLVLAGLADGAHRSGWIQFGAGLGVASAVMILLQMVTSGRFEGVSGWIGIDVTMAFHKWAAPVALVLALIHAVMMATPPDGGNPARFGHRLEALVYGANWTDARLALLLLALLVPMALWRERLARYEIWRASHGLMALGLIGVLLWHILSDGHGGAATAIFWVALTLAVLLPALWVYARRLVAPPTAFCRLHSSRKVADRLWEITLDRPAASLGYRAGQFAWVSFGNHRLPLFDHPFSILSAPSDPHLRFLIQEAGDFTDTLGTLPPGTRVGLDAPHGSFGVDPRGTSPLLLIAGGVGAAPILSVLADLAATGTRRPVRLIVAARGPGAMLPESFWADACDRLGIAPMLICDRDGAPGTLPGPLTETHLREALAGLDPARTRALICGPGPMMTFATDALTRLGVPLARIDYERFSYAAGSLSAKDRRMLAGFAGLFAAILAMVAAYSVA